MIQIIPKKEKKLPQWQQILSSLCFLMLIISLVSIPIFISKEKKAQSELQKINEEIEKAKTPEIRDLEREIIEYQGKIQKFSHLLQNHLFPSKFFLFLEKNTLKKVFFSTIDLNLAELKASLSGQTEDFVTLGKQILAFQNPNVKELTLSQLSIGKEGKIIFNLEISFAKDILVYGE